MKENIFNFTIEELKSYLLDLNEAAYRADQIMEWLYQKKITNFLAMSNLSCELRAKLSERLSSDFLIIEKKLLSKHDKSIKFLFSLHDEEYIETVFIPQSYGNSICISTQVGCKMGCKICASQENGFSRSLTAGEMILQVLTVMDNVQSDKNSLSSRAISSIVLMGIGEPLDNYLEVLKFIKIINYKHALNIGQRNITVSTSGIIPKIYELADEKLQITLAVSLHAADDNKRSQLMPINNKYHIDDLLEACKYYVEKTGRRVTFEYVLIDGFNDSADDALLLLRKVRDINCHINLIQFNHIKDCIFQPATEYAVTQFFNTIDCRGQQVTLRHSKGQDIDAACGQLRNRSSRM